MSEQVFHQWVTGTGNGNVEFWIHERLYISYNPAPPDSFLYPDQTGPQETVLVVDAGGEVHYLILEGDFRLQYEQAFKKRGGQGLLDLFLTLRPEFENNWSTTKDWPQIKKEMLK